MKTLAQAFETFLQKLELTSAERSNASDQHIYMREQLQQHLAVDENFLTGSYSRNTAIRPLNDIDIFVVLAPELRDTPEQCLALLQTTLETIYPNKTCKRQTRSVNIEFSGTGIAYDLVPAFRVDGDNDEDEVYEIPDMDAYGWIQSNPKYHKTRSTEANEDAGKKLKPLVKAVKHANYLHDKPARSFHLEVLAWGILTTDPGSYMDGLCLLLDELSKQVTLTCDEPAGLGPPVNPSAARCLVAQAWLGKMRDLAVEARRLSERGKLGEAHAKLRELFGAEWPEKGSPNVNFAAVTSGSAVDDSRSRFG